MKVITTDSFESNKLSMKSDKSQEPVLEIYLTTQKDYDILTNISRVCFSHQMRWKASKSFGRKWWDYLVNSDFCEVWTCACEGKIIAYGILILDRLKYEQSWQQFRPDFGSKLYILATRPDIIIVKVIERLKKCFAKKNEISGNNYAAQKDKLEKLFAQKVSWLGPIAVSPDMQKQGIATKVCEFCENRAAKLGYKEMWSYLRKSNYKSKRLITKSGFEIVEEINHLLFIKKKLNSNETRN